MAGPELAGTWVKLEGGVRNGAAKGSQAWVLHCLGGHLGDFELDTNGTF